MFDRLKDLYDNYRTAMMNRKYYGYKLAEIKKYNLIFEITIALGTASSGVAAWTIWKYGTGEKVWGIIIAVAVVLAFLKPFLKLSNLVERYSTLFIGYGDVAYDLKTIVSKVKIHRNFNKELDDAYIASLERSKQLASRDDPKLNKKLVRKCYDEVNKEVPQNELWIPKKGGQ